MMQPELIARVISLIQKNGDRIVLADPQTGKAVVVMDLESYEKLCTNPSPAAVAAPLAAPLPEPLPAPVQTAPKSTPPQAKKIAARSENIAQKKPSNFGPAKAPLTDLTQEELIDKINRDIGAWKTAQERRRTDELKSAAAPKMPQFELASALEEEERFYLEPIE